jgi:hypothetical protein
VHYFGEGKMPIAEHSGVVSDAFVRTRHLSEELDDLLKSLRNMGKAVKKIRRTRELPSLAIINKIMGEHAGSIRAITVCIDLELKKCMKGER